MGPEQSSMSPIHEILENKGVVTHFQPIHSARQKSIVGLEGLSRGLIGVEALSRGRIGDKNEIIPPARLFAMAAEQGVSDQLEKLCRERAIRSFAQLPQRPDELLLFLNFELSLIHNPQAVVEELNNQIQAAGITPRNVAIEVLENKIDDIKTLGLLLSRFREHGYLLVLDDVGTGHSNLDRIPLIRPDVLKIDRSLISGVNEDYYKQETLKSLVGLCRKIGALVVAEGIETQEEAIVSLELGADLLQGFFLGRPQASDAISGQSLEIAAQRSVELARTFKTYMVSKINERKLQYRKFNVILNQILCELTNVSSQKFDEVLARAIDHYPRVECVYVLDDCGTQVTNTIVNENTPGQKSGVLFRPAPIGADHSLKEYYYVLMDVELQKYTTDPYVSLASGNVCRTISTCFRDAGNSKMYVLCIDVLCEM